MDPSVYLFSYYISLSLWLVTLLYRVFQEERPLFWEVIGSAILGKKVYMYMREFQMVSKIELFQCIVPKLLIRKKYYILFPIYSSDKVGTVYLV
jgi:hypothetical protein